MKFKFTIGKRIGLGFGVLIFLTGIAFVLTLFTTSSSRKINDEINDIYTPSVTALEELNLTMVRSKMMIYKWAYFQSGNDNQDKVKLRNAIYTQLPDLQKKITTLSEMWKKAEQDSVKSLFNKIKELTAMYENEVMTPLSTFESYEDPSLLFIQESVAEGEIDSKYREILVELERLVEVHHNNSIVKSKDMVSSFNRLKWVVIILGIFLVVGGILTAIFTVRSIVKPIEYLKRVLLRMGKGVLPEEKMPDRNDEIGEMSVALNYMVDGLSSTTEFAREVGSGNFTSYYKPLSDEDTLGHALLKMRIGLEENERVLEGKIIERTEEVVRQKQDIEEKNHILGELYTQVTDSIRYAKRIQYSLLANNNMLRENLRDYFIFFKPKDVVSGDFYWASQLSNGNFALVTADSTGHGVPGAIMSILNISCLNEAIVSDKLLEPADILNATRSKIIKHLSNDGSEEGGKDGMDCSIVCFDFKNNKITYAAANNPVWIARNGELIALQADRMPIGKHDRDKTPFVQGEFEIQKGDVVYTLTDGFPDQFGGPQGKKFMSKQLQKYLLSISNEPMYEQYQKLDHCFEDWKGGLEQIDDVCLIGVQI
ncbi:MAG: SpoIIE family protein phosphatase [Bacteroidota bacterium]